MSLTFGGATTDKVDCGAFTDDLTTLTAMAWVYPTTLTNNVIIISKYRGSTAEGWAFRSASTGGSTGEIEIAWEPSSRSTTNTAPLSSTNKWYFVAATIDRGANAGHIYVGDLTTAMSEPTYGTSTWTGSYNSDAPRNLFIGNRDNTTPNGAFVGNIAFSAMFNTVLTSAQIEVYRKAPYKVKTDSACIGAWSLGPGTGTQRDFVAANNGTVTGATSGAHVPLCTAIKYL